MRRITTLILCLMLMLPLLGAAEEPSFPEDRLKILEESLIVANELDVTVFAYYAIVENIGPSPVYLEEARLLAYDAEAKQLNEETHVTRTPYTLMPGEKSYLNTYPTMLNGAAPSIASHKLHIKAGEPYDDEWQRTMLPVEASFELVDKGWPEGKLIATVTNDTEEPQFDLNVLVVLRDQDGKLLFITQDSSYSVGAPAGGQLLFRRGLESFLITASTKDNREIKVAECSAWVDPY